MTIPQLLWCWAHGWAVTFEQHRGWVEPIALKLFRGFV
jgi:hypothetical protein